MRGGVWEPETLDLIARECGSGDIVHAGTYFGDFLPRLSRAAGPDATVWAFEPSAEHYRCAQITLIINDVSNVVLTNAGVGAQPDSGALRVTDERGLSLGGGSRIVPAGDVRDAGFQPVSIVAIDDAVPRDRHVTVLQLDVEGYEHEALEGARATLERCRPLIIVERRLDDDWLNEHLAPLGYARTGRVHVNTVLRANRTN